MGLQLKTRLGVSPVGRGRIWLAFEETDAVFATQHFIDELLRLLDCAVFYCDDPSEFSFYAEDLKQAQVVLILLTPVLVDAPPSWLCDLLEMTSESKIPLLPVLKDPVSSDKFEHLFGKVQFLTLFRESDTELSYEEKLSNALRVFLGDNKEKKRIRDCFRKMIFLSYRKMDRAQAQTLMKLIHSNKENFDVAIWYDEHLTAGNEFEPEIFSFIESSDLFVLNVTPNIMKPAADGKVNYAVGVELPKAQECNKDILAVEMLPSGPDWVQKLELNQPKCQCLTAENAARYIAQKFHDNLNLMDEASPEKQYLLGCAYLGGVLVEANRERGVRLVEQAAQRDHLPAVVKMRELYRYGNGVPRDLNISYKWFEKQLNLLLKEYTCLQKEDADSEQAKTKFVDIETVLGVGIQECLDSGMADHALRYAQTFLDIIERFQAQSDDFFDAGFQTLQKAEAMSYIGDAYFRKQMLDEAIEWLKRSCMPLQNLIEEIHRQAYPIRFIALEQQTRKTLQVNLDHLSDYLIRQGRVKEAEEVLAMFAQHNSADQPRSSKEYSYIEYVRRSEIYQNTGDHVKAILCLEYALQVLDKSLAQSQKWASRIQKAQVLNRLAGLYLYRRDLDQKMMQQASAYIQKSLEICDSILKYSPDDPEALREKSICLEHVGHFNVRRGNVPYMLEMYHECESLRVDILHRFPSTMAENDLNNVRNMIRTQLDSLWRQSCRYLAEKWLNLDENTNLSIPPYSIVLQDIRAKEALFAAGLYLPGTFLLTDARVMDANGLRHAVLSPKSSTYALISRYYPNLSTAEALNQACRTIYTAPIKPVLRFFRTWMIGEEVNVSLSNVGAELLLGAGVLLPDHTLYLYEIIDSLYRKYYVLYTSMAALEAKVAELCVSGLLSADGVMWNGDHFAVDRLMLNRLIDILVQDYFRAKPSEGYFAACSMIVPLKEDSGWLSPDGEYKQVLNDSEGNCRFCYAVAVGGN